MSGFRFRLGGTALVLLTILAVSVVGEEHNIHGLQEKDRSFKSGV